MRSSAVPAEGLFKFRVRPRVGFGLNDDVDWFQAEMRAGRQEVPVVAVDFGEAVFGGGCQVKNIA